MRKPSYYLIFLLLLLSLLAGCSSASATTDPASVNGTPVPTKQAPFVLTSPAFKEGDLIPKKYSCQGEDISPEFNFSQPPAGTQSLALVIEDPDAPGGTWTHWVVYNIPPNALQLPEGASRGDGKSLQLPAGAEQGKNSFNRVNYGGPCPPSGMHHYYIRYFAVDKMVKTGAALDSNTLLSVFSGHILAQGELLGTFQK